MRTPFCAAVRIAAQAVDEVRLAIAEGQEELTCLSARDAVLLASTAVERALATRRIELPSTGWFERQAREQRDVRRRHAEVELAMADLRNEATTRLASLKSLEAAAERFRSIELRRRSRREQAEADDRSALQFLAASRAALSAGFST